MLCAVKLRVLGLVAYWYTGSAFHQIPQSYLRCILERALEQTYIGSLKPAVIQFTLETLQ